MSDRSIIVTGGAGFLGSHLCDRLVERGDHVTCVDDLSTGRSENIAHLVDHERFDFLEFDIVGRGLDELLPGGVTHVVHLASPASPPEYLRRPLDTLAVNSTGTQHLLEIAERHGARFFLASTSEVYGDPLVHPQVEEYWGNVNPIGERSVYDESKRFSEALTMAYHRAKGLDVRIVRIFNTYGPRMRVNDGRAIPAFMSQALSGEDVTVFGDGGQTRSLCYVSDLVDGIVRLMLSDVVDPVNLGNPEEMSIRALAEKIIALTGSSSRIVERPLPVDDPKVRQPDITRARTLLDWEPRVPLDEGLDRTLAYFRRKLGV